MERLKNYMQLFHAVSYIHSQLSSQYSSKSTVIRQYCIWSGSKLYAVAGSNSLQQARSEVMICLTDNVSLR